MIMQQFMSSIVAMLHDFEHLRAQQNPQLAWDSTQSPLVF